MSIWSQVQGTGAQGTSSGVSSLSASFVSAVASGDLVCTGCSNFSYYSFSQSVDDNNVNPYTVDTGVTVVGPNVAYTAIAHSVVPTGGTLTLTWNLTFHGNFVAISIDEFSAPGATISVDNVVDSNTVTGTATPSVGTLAVSGNDLIYAILLNETTGTITPGSGFTASYSVPGIGGAAEGISAEYQLNQTSNVNPGWTCTLSGTYIVCGAAYKATGGGPTFSPYWVPRSYLIGPGCY
jgi:hypothetical protein